MDEPTKYKCDICHEETYSPYWIKPQGFDVVVGNGADRIRYMFSINMCKTCKEKFAGIEVIRALRKGMEAIVSDEKD